MSLHTNNYSLDMVTSDNYAKLATAIVTWMQPRAMALLSQQHQVIKINEWLRKQEWLQTFVNLLGLDLRNYGVVDELGFLVNPMLNRIGSTYIVEGLKKLAPDDQIIEVAKEIVNSALTEAGARPNKKINFFGVLFDVNDLAALEQSISAINI